MFYTILTIFFLVVFYILSLFMLPVTWLVRKANREKGDMMSLRYVQWGFKGVLFFGGFHLKVLGKENIPAEKAVLFVGNHRSIFDIVSSYSVMPNRTGYISKESIGKIPVIATWMRRLYCLFMKREDLKQSLQVILQAADYLKDGISICIYPEGTRNKTDEPVQEFHAGSFKPAERSGAPILPMAIAYDKPVFEDHLPRLMKTNVVLKFGEPIETESLSKEEKKNLPKRVQDVIREMYSEALELLDNH